ncbi:MAG TPA: family 10 glycosylhydrolase, partial [Verrucomicrobiae bacterium]|nr:family 10 glycosylhydrolase [Verrucomicrobiae bacterium]
NRRDFLKSSAVASLGLHTAGRIFAESAESSANEKLILSAPLTHSDWSLKNGIPWGEPGVRHMLDACKTCGWSRIYWRALDGGRSLYKSKLMRPQGPWDEDNFWNPQSETDKQLLQRFTPNMTPEQRAALRSKFSSLDYARFDSLGAAVRYGHEIGLQIHAWVSINEDDHGWGLQSEFSKKHPQYRWRKRDGTFYHSQLSFAFPAVREYKLAILKELLRNYSIDGIFLDWIRTGDVRDNPQTDTQGVADSGYEEPLVQGFKKKFGIDPRTIPNDDQRWVHFRAGPQTEFMRAARKLVRSHNHNLPLAVMVDHPWSYRGEMNRIDGNLRGLLLDVNAWAREGLMDAAVAAGYYRDGGTPKMAYEALQKETEGKVDVWSYAWVPQSVAEFQNDVSLAHELKANQVLFWEADYIDDRAQAAELKTAMSRYAL